MTDQPVPDAVTVTSAVLRAWPLPEPGASKESRGRTVVVGGSVQTPGAVLLAAEGALRAGAGKLQVATVASLAPALAVALPEALVQGLPETRDGAIAAEAADAVVRLADGAASVLVGPGMGDIDACRGLLERVLPRLSCTPVLDALALAQMTSDPGCLAHLDGAVLTPNPHELALTLGVEDAEVDKDAAAATLRAASQYRAAVATGGGESWVAAPDGRLWRDQSGSVGLGVSGSGDVLAGMVTGLVARGARPEQAAVWAVHLHGRAGDRLAAAVGRVGYLARELPAQVPLVLAEIEA
jgi:ADP-dependent NAD(P)H-hydrate dehydratase